jgi:hypothetical protein
MKKSLFIYIFFLQILGLVFSFDAFAYNIQVQEENNGIKLKISEIEPNYLTKESRLTLNTTSIYTSINPNSELKSEAILIPFCLPEKLIGNINYNISKSKTQKFDKNIPAINDYSIEITKYNDNLNYRVGFLYIQPFKLAGNSLEYINEIEISLEFDQNVGISDKQTENYLRNYIINKKHFDYLDLKESPKANLINPINSWYDKTKNYLEIKTTSDELCVINKDSIIKYLPQLGSKDLKYLHLLNRGNEVYLGTFPDGFAFIGSRPKGDTTWLNSYSKYESFFLYYDESSEGLRYSTFPNVNASKELEFVRLNKHFEDEKEYAVGYDYIQTRTCKGEYWLWKIIEPYSNNTFEYPIDFTPYSNSSDSAKLEIGFSSVRLNSTKGWFRGHHYRVDINNKKIDDEIVKDGEYYKLNYSISNNDFSGSSSKFYFKTTGVLDSTMVLVTNDYIGLDYFNIETKILPVLSKDVTDFYVDKLSQNSSVRIKNFAGAKFIIDEINNYFLYDSNSGSEKIISLESDKEYHLYCSDNKGKQPEFNSVNSTDYLNKLNKANVLVITHHSLKSGVDSLIKATKKYNPSLNYFVADIDDIYKEFNYGNKSPHAIRDFVHLTQTDWQKSAPKYVFIIGDANLDSRNFIEKSSIVDLVPSYGWPYSDFWYTTQGDSVNNKPEIAISRLTAQSNIDIFNYIDKLNGFYNSELNPWKKTFLLLSGGGDGEGEAFENYMKYAFAPVLVEPNLCADTLTVHKSDNNATGESDGQKIMSIINKGVGFTTFLGHGSPTVFDVDGWNSKLLNNKDKYGFLLTISCNSSAFGESNVTSRNEEYVLEKDKGFISAAGSTFVTSVMLGVELQNNINLFLADTSMRIRNYAELINLSKYKLLAYGSEYQNREAYAYQFTILGDPLLNVYPSKYAELYFLKDYVKFQNPQNTTITENDNFITITGTLFNNGYNIDKPFRLIAVRNYNNKLDTYSFKMNDICFKNNFKFTIPIKDKPGTHRITIIADVDNNNREDSKANNIYSFDFDVFKIGLLAFEPLPYWNVSATNPEFRVINPIKLDGKIKYDFKIIDRSDSLNNTIIQSTQDEITIDSNFIDWKPKALFSPNQSLIFACRYSIESGFESEWNIIPFYTANIPIADSARLVISSKEEWQEQKLENLGFTKKNNKETLSLVFDKINTKIESSLEDTLNHISQSKINVNGNDIIWTQSAGIRPRGLNLVNLNGETGEVKSKRTYDSFGDDSSSIKFMEYIKDSVDITDIILFTICDRAFHVPMLRVPQDSPGSIDSMKIFFKSLGSKFADEIGYNTAYCFAASRNPKNSFIKEAIDTTGTQLLVIDTSFTFNRFNGQLETRIVGPARKWISINPDINFSNDSSSVEIKIYGINKKDLSEVLLGTFKNQLHIDLTSLNALIYTKLKIIAKLQNEKYISANKQASISSINVNFIPLNEYAIYNHLTYMNADSLERGDSVIFHTTVRNLSKRIPSMLTELKFVGGDVFNNVEYHKTFVPSLAPDQKYEYSFTRFTDKYLKGQNDFFITINDSTNIDEFFTFNNDSEKSLFIIEDTLKPWFEMYVDDKLVTNKDFVQIKPKIKIKIHDNSRMPIYDIKNWAFRLNAKWKSLKPVTYTSFDRDITLKGEFEYESDSLDYGENFFSLYSLDGNGIRDTFNIVLNVSQNGLVEKLVNFPNPFAEITYFKFVYKAPITDATARIEIYDYNGREVNKLYYHIRIGENDMFWDGKDYYGNELPIGFYLYKIYITNVEEIYVEPIFGKFMILR